MWPGRPLPGTTRRLHTGPAAALLVGAVVSAVLAVPPPAAAAASCLPAGGRPLARSTTQQGDFVVVGGGFGHGVGMSQYGARGAAALGCSRNEILGVYYPGAVVTPSGVPAAKEDIRVSLHPVGPSGPLPSTVDIAAVSAGVPWTLGGVTRQQPAGRTWRATVGARGRYTVTDGAKTVFPATAGPLRITLDGKIVRLPGKGRRYNRGTLELRWKGSGARSYVTAVLDSVDRYLYGLAEMPALWPQVALQAQAVAGRTYVLQKREGRATGSAKWATCRCDVYDSVLDQVYAAYSNEHPAWVRAVDATSGVTLRYGGKTITALYSSSSGGFIESSRAVFGGTLPYSTSVDDSRWERASGNPYSAWVQPLTAQRVGAAFRVGTALAVKTPSPRTPSGRVGDPARGDGGVVIIGTGGTRRVSGSAFRSMFGLRSTLFSVKSAIDQRHAALGGDVSFLSAPRAPERTVAAGRVRRFTRGRIYWSPATGAKWLRGPVARRYRRAGGPKSRLGFPTSDVYRVAVGRRADFQGGRIVWRRATGTVRIRYR